MLMKLYLSIDLESWAYPNIPAFTGLSSIERKEIDNGFVLESTNKILDLLDQHNQKITFFSLGQIFEWYPDLFEKIQLAGHEIGYHSHSHRRIDDGNIMDQELLCSRDFLEACKPVGFRAPNIYLPQSALESLGQNGFLYSSSIYGSYTDNISSTTNSVKEFPVSTYTYSSKNIRVLKYPRPMQMSMLRDELPIGSGYFLALLPSRMIVKVIDSLFRRGEPVIMFLHNWQICPPNASTFPSLGYKLTHPAYFPYTLPLWEKFEFFAKNYQFGKTIELLNLSTFD